MTHYSYGKFTLQARKARQKLVDQLPEWEWFNAVPVQGEPSEAKKILNEMDEILKTVDPAGRDDLLDTIEDLSEENKTKLADLLGLKYEPIHIGEFEEDWE